MRDFVLGQNDEAGPLETVLVDDDGDAVDLTGATVTFALAPPDGGALVFDDVVEVVVDGAADPPITTADGRVRVPAADEAWPPDVVATPRSLLGRFRVEWDDGRRQSFPNEGYVVVLVTPDVGTVKVGDLLDLDPSLDAAKAGRVLALARRVVDAYLAPGDTSTVLADSRVELVVLRQALRVARASPPSSSAGAIVSESLGSYTYRLDRPLPLDTALQLDADLQRELLPFAPHRSRVYSAPVGLGDRRAQWPVDWWQRNLDNLDDEPAVPLP